MAGLQAARRLAGATEGGHMRVPGAAGKSEGGGRPAAGHQLRGQLVRLQLDGHHGDVVHHALLLHQPLGPGGVHQLRGVEQGGGAGG